MTGSMPQARYKMLGRFDQRRFLEDVIPWVVLEYETSPKRCGASIELRYGNIAADTSGRQPFSLKSEDAT